MENAGLNKLWTESCVYATNTIETIVEGKTYYSSARGHRLTYEELWHILWPQFEMWLGENDHTEDAKFIELARLVSQKFR